MSDKDLKNNQEIEKFDQSYFEFASSDREKGIKDEAFKTKPTTFFKDAMKRFVKNKSSVVGAVIIGLLLLGSFTLPYITGHDIKTPHADLKTLPPKLFKAGTGWWDGTTSFSNIGWDGSVVNPDGTTGAPAEMSMSAVVPGTLKVDDVTYIDRYYKYAAGGYIRITSDYISENPEEHTVFFTNYTTFNFTSADEMKLDIEFGDTDSIDGDHLVPHRVYLQYYYSGATQLLALDDGWNQENTFSVDLSAKISAAGLSEANKCKIRIEGLPEVSSSRHSYFLLKTLSLSSNVTDEEQVLLLNEISIDNANFTAGKPIGSVDEENFDYWQSNGSKHVYHAEQRKVSFRYDYYEAVLGDRYDFVIGGSILNEYKDKGWCTFDTLATAEFTFQVLDAKKCPVKEIYSADYDAAYDVWQFKTCTTYYKYLGYSKMPSYLLGTTSNGHDLLTLGMSCLKTSLLIAIISSAFCLAIGLVWGSISGYFGGTVDIVMERITDIINGVPWIIMMTLIILLLGQNAVTFAIALIMTGWIGTASRTRTQFYRFKGREYVLASRTLGASDARLIFRHILPNGLGTIVTGSVLMIPSCIFSEATISYLGLGLKGLNSFGVLLSSNQKFLESYPILVVFPAIIISLLMISFNLFGNGLRDALNPTLKGGEQ